MVNTMLRVKRLHALLSEVRRAVSIEKGYSLVSVLCFLMQNVLAPLRAGRASRVGHIRIDLAAVKANNESCQSDPNHLKETPKF